MNTTLALLLLWLLFGITHSVPTSQGVRERLVARLGRGGYVGLYSLVSFATFVPLVWVYVANRHAGPLLWSLRNVSAVWWVAFALAGLGFTLTIFSFFQPSPFAMGAPSRLEPYGLTRITRHPLFMPVSWIAAGHLLLFGWATDIAFFGGLAAYTVLGCAHQDRRRRASEGPRLEAFFAQSSLLPFAAIFTGRTRLVLEELPWLGLAIGAGAAYGFFRLHPVMF
ncbi:MAG TPA: NnrU family protein [Thermoanaerobaculia bacterium]|nr:NnrU family protein [Thermoanaerobaculia bacterium]